MNIDKNKFRDSIIKKDYENAFKNIYEIAGFIGQRSFSLTGDDLDDAVQQATISCWKKIIDKKVDNNQENLFSFFYKNCWFAISDNVRSEIRKKRRVKAVSDSLLEILDDKNEFCNI